MISRGLRNNNPGNIRRSKIRYEGEVRPSRDREFKEFSSMAYGYRAMFVLLHSYNRRYGLNSIRGMLNRYAPPTENFTEGYIRFVASRTGIDANTIINTLCERDMVAIVRAMSEIENGTPAILEDVELGWKLFVEDLM